MTVVKVISEVAGVVTTISAQPGDAVRAEDTVVLLECMKMEIPVGAPRAGTVSEVLVKPGDQVSEGQLVARLDVA